MNFETIYMAIEWIRETKFDFETMFIPSVNAVIITLAIVSLYKGTTLWTEKGFNRKALFILIGGFFFVLIAIITPIFYTTTFLNLRNILQPSKEMLHPNNLLEEDCNIKMQLNIFSRSQQFIHNGKLNTYTNCEGEEVLYVPTQSDIDTFKSTVELNSYVEASKSSTIQNAFTWMYIAILSILLGWDDIRQKKRDKAKQH